MTRPTLLCLARAPVEGRVKTRLASQVGDEKALEIYRHLLSRTADLLAGVRELDRAIDRRVLVLPADATDRLAGAFDDEVELLPQAEGDLGTSLEAGFAEAFEEGGGPVCAIGTDCPEMEVDDVDRAFRVLEDETYGPADAVFGPATDGGYYLVGLSEPTPAIFREVSDWGGPDVLTQSLDRLKDLGKRVALLKPRTDVDWAADLDPELREVAGLEGAE